ncbi:Oidioi.mRNA.OKI2018_I69.PAR.g8928.t1.cds [Oikopleura dioica]|uniref:Oidioi.mRNA.OKI2018_I69.PAR.g8928.t1.cds n=1 Tax=Oikopleura dioica TaxID=34765 RepID=A0ABN7RP86_OIKDI|nr:Oidioi.mRNA.OKI2018_I69.PAR.g8928.t1.cds [Oikopleura dioica]
MIRVFLLINCLFGAKIEKDEANAFLRVRRANTGYEEYMNSGNLERECIEETCDSYEFHEVYDDHSISDPLLNKYILCKESEKLYNDGNATSTPDFVRTCFENEDSPTICNKTDIQRQLAEKNTEINELKDELKNFKKIRFLKGKEKMEFLDADRYCKHQGGRLAFFNTEHEYNQYIRLKPFRQEHIGMRSVTPENQIWRNVDGSVPYINWQTPPKRLTKQELAVCISYPPETCGVAIHQEFVHLEIGLNYCDGEKLHFTCRLN